MTAGARPRWDGALYAANTAHHRRHDADVLAGVDIQPNWRILDIGCGVGDFSAHLASLVPDGEVLGIDPESSLLDVARDRFASARNLEFAQGRAQDLLDVARPPYDLVVSTACLHWVPGADHPKVLRGVHDVLRTGGVFRVEFGGAGQIAAARAVLDEVCAQVGAPPWNWYFPSVAQYEPMLRDADLTWDGGWVRLLHQQRAMPDAEALRGYLTSQVLVGYEAAMTPTQQGEFRPFALGRAVRELRREDGSYDQDYVRMDVLARRS